jgi:hypothetical protein
VLYLCHCLYRTSVPLLPVHYSIPNTACIPLSVPATSCITPLCPLTSASSVCYSWHFLYHSSASSSLPVQCAAIPATSVSQLCLFIPASSVCCYSCHFCITALPLHHCQFSVLFLPLPVSQLRPFTIASSVCYSYHCLYQSFCLIIPASSVCCYSCHFCITGMAHHHCQFSVLFLPLPVSQLFLFIPASTECYACHCLYHNYAPSSLPVQCAMPATACITALPLHLCQSVCYSCHFLYHSSASSSLPVQCAIPATACITALPLHPCQFSVLFLSLLYHRSAPSPLTVQCAIPATACITALPLQTCQFSVLFLPLPVSQLCPFIIASSVCYSCHCLYYSSAPSPLPAQCAIPATACITALPLHHCQLSVLFLPLPVSQQCPPSRSVQCSIPATLCTPALSSHCQMSAHS